LGATGRSERCETRAGARGFPPRRNQHHSVVVEDPSNDRGFVGHNLSFAGADDAVFESTHDAIAEADAATCFPEILTIAGPNIESITAPPDAALCARIANDEMAALVAAHPDRFIGACACLPMTDIDAALAEAERAIDTLGFLGVEIFTDIAGKPLDSPEFPIDRRTRIATPRRQPQRRQRETAGD
jgi:predicted TIM-barrel fold metal-dependent hydrolase